MAVVRDDKCTAVTIVVTCLGMGSDLHVKVPFNCPHDAGTREEYVAIPVVGSVV